MSIVLSRHVANPSVSSIFEPWPSCNFCYDLFNFMQT